GNIENTHKLLTTIQLLKEQLLGKGTDVSKIQLQAEQLTTQRENVFSKYTQVLNALKLNMGISLEQTLTVETEINQTNLTDNSTRNSLDLKLINTQNTLLHNELKTLNRSRFLPSLNLIASYGTTGFGYDKTPNDFLDFYPIGFAGVQLSYPLFNGTVTQRKINQKKLEINNNKLQAKIINDKTETETSNATYQSKDGQTSTTNTEN